MWYLYPGLLREGRHLLHGNSLLAAPGAPERAVRRPPPTRDPRLGGGRPAPVRRSKLGPQLRAGEMCNITLCAVRTRACVGLEVLPTALSFLRGRRESDSSTGKRKSSPGEVLEWVVGGFCWVNGGVSVHVWWSWSWAYRKLLCIFLGGVDGLVRVGGRGPAERWIGLFGSPLSFLCRAVLRSWVFASIQRKSPCNRSLLYQTRLNTLVMHSLWFTAARTLGRLWIECSAFALSHNPTGSWPQFRGRKMTDWALRIIVSPRA